MQIETKEA